MLQLLHFAGYVFVIVVLCCDCVVGHADPLPQLRTDLLTALGALDDDVIIDVQIPYFVVSCIKCYSLGLHQPFCFFS